MQMRQLANLAGQSEGRPWARFTAFRGADAWRYDVMQKDELSQDGM